MTDSLPVTAATTKFSSTRRITAAATIGSYVDWYDWFISATAAAIVWPIVFFKFVNGPAALGLSLLTYSVACLSRPIGGMIFGHLGDRRGRKTTLVLTLITMGVLLFGIALTPGYVSIGIAAPILIMIFRVVFGLGVGGEFGGATS